MERRENYPHAHQPILRQYYRGGHCLLLGILVNGDKRHEQQIEVAKWKDGEEEGRKS